MKVSSKHWLFLSLAILLVALYLVTDSMLSSEKVRPQASPLQGIIEGQSQGLPLRGEQFMTMGIPIDLNQATLEDLESLPGVGRKLAQGILQYRFQNGRFHTVEELKNIKGFGEKKFKSLIPYVKVNKISGM